MSNRIKLTKDSIKKIQLPPGKREAIVYDSEIGGFGLRIREGGSRTFIYQYKIGTQNRRLTLGTATVESFGTVKSKTDGTVKLCIRDRVLQLQAQVRLGTDPAGVKETKREEAAQTFGNVAGVLTTLANNNGPVLANRVRATISSMFTWAMKQGLAETNPVIGTEKREETPRKRVLSDAELVEIWNAVPDSAFGDIVKLLMLTAQRRTEIGALRWSEVDVDEASITLPETRTKNGVEHVVPLSDAAAEILSRQLRIIGRDTIFGRGVNGISGWGEGKTAIDNRIQEARTKASGCKAVPMAEWTLHDLRRSAATGMAKLGVAPHVIEAVLNHISGHKAGVAGIYNRNTYEPEKRQALTLWAEHLMAVIHSKPAKVTPIRAA